MTTGNAVIGIGLSMAVWLWSGCDAFSCDTHDGAECGEAPGCPIVALSVTVGTGDNGTDCDIYFCYLAASAPDWSCTLLDRLFYNDFEADAVDTYEIGVEPIAAGDLWRMKLVNAGGGAVESEWTIASLTVEGVLSSGESVTLYDQPEIGCDNEVASNSSWETASCDWSADPAPANECDTYFD